jgi:ribosomal protein S18 acetylase RimI-like enzyme
MASVSDDLPGGLTARHPTEDDHAQVLAVLDQWWGGFGAAEGAAQRAQLLPRLFFQHFTDSSWLVEDADGALRAFLVGFLSPARPDVAYIHFAGVDPALHGAGIGAALYRRFLAYGVGRGAHTAACITSPGNTASLTFHARSASPCSPAMHCWTGSPFTATTTDPACTGLCSPAR